MRCHRHIFSSAYMYSKYMKLATLRLKITSPVITFTLIYVFLHYLQAGDVYQPEVLHLVSLNKPLYGWSPGNAVSAATQD